MQIKIIIATVAFMLTMIVFGYAALREPARMETTQEAFEARTIEKGAEIFFSNCATCHGQNGEAQTCVDNEGTQIACLGLPLNNPDLLCGPRSPRMEAMGWAGSKYAFIYATVQTGRAGGAMPTWGATYGGPLEDYQVDQVTNFVLNWETEELCAEPAAPDVEWPETVAGLPAGDPANGEELYNLTFGCSACHGNIDESGSNAVGPWAGDFADMSGTRKEGYSAATYLYESILLPSDFIAPECPTGPCAGPPSGMPANFGDRMTPQDMADVMAFLLGTTTFEGDTAIQYPPQ